jgi:hypothetical protein
MQYIIFPRGKFVCLIVRILYSKLSREKKPVSTKVNACKKICLYESYKELVFDLFAIFKESLPALVRDLFTFSNNVKKCS